MSAEVAKWLDGALEDLRGGDAHAALGKLLSAWRAVPTERLAAVVCAAGDRAETGLAPIAGKTLAAKVAAATALVERADPVDLPRVLRLLPDIRIPDAKALAEAVAAFLPDPRYLRDCLTLVHAWPWGGGTSRQLWRILFGNLVEPGGDPRADAALAALDFAKLADSEYGAREVTAVVERLRKKLAKVKAVAHAEPPQVAALEAALAQAGQSGSELLAAIYANPRDLAPRAIYADWLTERGDPRGELITLQLAAAPTDEQRRRIRALLAEREAEWLGPIESATREGWRRFAAGFLVAANVDIPKALATLDAPEWATLEEMSLDLSDVPFPHALLAPPHFPALRFLGGIEVANLGDLARLARPLAGLGFEFPEWRDAVGEAERELVRAIVARPEVTTVQFDGAKPDQLAWFWSTQLGAQCTRLRTSSGLGSAAAWLRDPRVPARVASIQVTFNHGYHAWTVELARGADGRLSRVDAVLRPSLRSHQTSKAVDLVEDFLDELAPDALEHFALVLDGTTATKSDLAKIAAALARQTRLASHALPGDAVVPAAAPAAKTVKAARAEAAAAAHDDARGALARAVAALGEPVSYLADVDFANRVRCADAKRYLDQLVARGDIPPAYADVCWALLELPVGERGDHAARRGVQDAAIAVLDRLAPAGACARATSLLERHAVLGLQSDLTCVPRAELPQLFDWFEQRRGAKFPPRADTVYYAVRDAAIARGDAATLAELKRRLGDKKQLRFVTWAYQAAIRELTDKLAG